MHTARTLRACCVHIACTQRAPCVHTIACILRHCVAEPAYLWQGDDYLEMGINAFRFGTAAQCFQSHAVKL